MSEGELKKRLTIQETPNHKQWVKETNVELANILNEAKAEFPVKYVYDAWEMPETNKQKEKKICEAIAWYLKWFGSPVNMESVNDGENKK